LTTIGASTPGDVTAVARIFSLVFAQSHPSSATTRSAPPGCLPLRFTPQEVTKL
jgi:hypothetical protein